MEMTNGRGYILVEGHGEVEAAHNLIVRLSKDVGLSLVWSRPSRWNNLHQWGNERGIGGVRKGLEFIRSKSDASALIILRDEDDRCPKEVAPRISSQIRLLGLPFPVAYILLHPEYEVLFLPCLEKMSFPAWDGETWESRRGIKEWLSAQLPSGRSYKPTVDQLPMTRKIDFDILRDAQVPCFGTLERALFFLKENIGIAGSVYPPGDA